MRIEFRIQESQWTHISISSKSELRGSKDGYVSNMILRWNGKADSLLGWSLPKLPIISINCSNKSCWELNFVQKSQWTHTSISAREGARALEKLIYIVLNIYCTEMGKYIVSLSGWELPKLLIISKNCSELNLVQKSHWAHMSISCRSGAMGSKDNQLKNIIMHWEMITRLTKMLQIKVVEH